MNEHKLEVKQNGQHLNTVVKTRYKWDKEKKVFVMKDGKRVIVEQGLPINSFVIVEKLYAEGVEHKGEFGSSFSCKVKYNDQTVSFWLKDTKTQKDYTNFSKCGGVNDKIKISCVKEPQVNRKTGNEELVEVLKFEKV